ncbi:MAG: beta-lactamase family protein [Acidobacteriia bacterium]|nr:beta-lactamase family protein [Terriglobia bacterium]
MVLLILLLLAVVPAAVADDQLRMIDGIFQPLAGRAAPGCAVGVLHNGRTFAKGYGMADLEQGIALTPQSRFYMASVSKQFTAMAVLLAEQEGKLRLDDPLTRHIPEMPGYASGIPLRRMLDHTAGLRDYLALWNLKGWSTNSVLREAPTLSLVARQKALDFAPGEDHSYSNTGYFLMALVIERATGMNLNAYLQERLFIPLGMRATRFQHDHSDPVPNRAHGHAKSGDGWKIHDTSFDLAGSGGLYSNVEDMLVWARNFEDPKVGAKLLPALAAPGVLNDGRTTPNGYALGLRRATGNGLLTISHSGGAIGYRTFFARWPERRLAIMTLCNGDSSPEDLTQRVAAGILGTPEPGRPRAAKPAAAQPADWATHRKLAGVYWSDELETVWRITNDGGALVLENEGGRQAITTEASGGYRAGAGVITVRQEASGAVTGLLVSAGRARGIIFSRR